MRALAAAGIGVLLVDHDVELVFAVCDEVVVLDGGRVVAQGPPEQVRVHPAVRTAYLGTGPDGGGAAAAPRPRRAPTGDTTPARPGSAAANAVAPALLSVESVTGRYGGRRRGVLALAGGGVPAGAPVVREVSLSVEAGEIVALLGPNGAGKTTLIRMIAGQLPPVAGTITLLGAPTRRTTPDKLARRGLAVVPQGHGSVPTLTVRENLRLAVRHPAPRGATPAPRPPPRPPPAPFRNRARLPPGRPGRSARTGQASGSPRCSTCSRRWAGCSAATPAPCPAASASSWRSRSRWSADPRCCWSTSSRSGSRRASCRRCSPRCAGSRTRRASACCSWSSTSRSRCGSPTAPTSSTAAGSPCTRTPPTWPPTPSSSSPATSAAPPSPPPDAPRGPAPTPARGGAAAESSCPFCQTSGSRTGAQGDSGVGQAWPWCRTGRHDRAGTPPACPARSATGRAGRTRRAARVRRGACPRITSAGASYRWSRAPG
ncbi:ATP-binding cassette domain-containing protein [Frankia sp. CN6]|uniref:ATP-binding cassette domain-containing protein n=2 Tax=Frankia nepalensis TaxID=1836974 RepID=A0A937RCL2_9ACTN|nr:ATP-binding cassette domain-containing protein [Frankia nepalensis]